MEDHLGRAGPKGCVLTTYPLDAVINGRFLTQPVTGVQRYARELIKALDALLIEGALPGLRLEIVAPRGVSETLGLTSIPVRQGGTLRGHAWEQVELPSLTGGRVLLSLCNTGPAAVRRQVVTIHDAAVFARPRAYSLAFRVWYRTLLRHLARSALGVITPSAFSRRALSRYCGVDEHRLEIVPHGHEHVLTFPSDQAVIERHGLGTRPFVLAVASMTANKNIATIAAAKAHVGEDIDVVVAGGRNAKVFAAHSVPPTVRCLGYVTEGELRALYEKALCLVHPSWHEGFGFPPLEAMACGCPVIASRAGALQEVCGDAALYCKPDDGEELAARIREVVDDASLRLRLREAGHRQAAGFTWRASALRHARILEKLLGQPTELARAPRPLDAPSSSVMQ